MADTDALIRAERQRQTELGYTARHDDLHTTGELLLAAQAYELAANGNLRTARRLWPWDAASFRPGTPERCRIKAGALRLAEQDRLARARRR